MDKKDFLTYYQIPLGILADNEPEAAFALFPSHAEKWGTHEREKSINALYRFLNSGLLSAEGCWPYANKESALKALTDSGKEADTQILWHAQIFDPTKETITLGQKYNLTGYVDEAFSEDFFLFLSELFTKKNVGFEKGNLYPPA